MELISGETLTTKIHHDKTDLRTLLGFLSQAAEGLAKAHAAGIVHRDLKPSNIMVSRDGFTKILDFGLAKLTERGAEDQDATLGATQADDGTRVGTVVGTAGYMSPEQVQGKPVDHRSDIFSFGCVLYEAVTRRKPFMAESSIETMHKIIHENPTPVEEVNDKVPAEVRRLVRRCLAKNPEQRLQSAKDLALELREIVDEFDSLSASGSSGTVAEASATAGKNRFPWAIVAGAAVVAIVGISLAAWGLRRAGLPSTDSAFQRMKITTLTSRGDVSDAMLSPDGRYLAHTVGPDTKRSLLIRQVATGSDVTVLSESPDSPRGLQFSPDGNYLYYLGRDPDSPSYSALFQVASLGGTPRKRLFDVDRAVSFSPDGSAACFLRGAPQDRASGLYIWNADTGAERLLASVKDPQSLLVADPAWSPDGRRIAVIRAEPGAAGRNITRVVFYRLEDGGEEAAPALEWPFLSSIAWLPDGKSLAVTGLDVSGAPVTQIGILPYPKGPFRRVTNDLNQYQSVSVAARDTLMAAIRTQRVANLWTSTLDGAATQRTFGTTPEQSMLSFAPALNGAIVHGGLKDDRPVLFVRDVAGGEPRQLTSPPGFYANFRVQGDVVVYQHVSEGTFEGRLFACDLNGGNRRQIASGSVGDLSGLSPDGKYVLAKFNEKPGEVWVVPTQGGEPRLFAKAEAAPFGFSPDGTRVGLFVWEQVGDRVASVFKIRSFPEGKEMAGLVIESGTDAGGWDPDGGGFTYGRTVRGVTEMRRWRFDRPTSVSAFPWAHGQIADVDWSPDGKTILIVSREGQTSNIWSCDQEGRNQRPVTDFKTGTIFNVAWSLDGASVVFTYGTLGSDAILIKNYQ
jgi:Tol biopolymer transport system component